jgi:hypothetical protein
MWGERMIVTELITDILVRHYSDDGFYILQNETGVMYEDAVDVIPCKFTYSETNELINKMEAI